MRQEKTIWPNCNLIKMSNVFKVKIMQKIASEICENDKMEFIETGRGFGFV